MITPTKNMICFSDLLAAKCVNSILLLKIYVGFTDLHDDDDELLLWYG